MTWQGHGVTYIESLKTNRGLQDNVPKWSLRSVREDGRSQFTAPRALPDTH